MSTKDNVIKQDVHEIANTNESEIKQEVISAYNEVLRKLTVVKTAGSKEEKLKQIHEEQAILEEKHNIEVLVKETPDDLIKNMTELKGFINKELRMLEEKLLPIYEKFHNLRRAITFSENELSEHHDIKVNVNTLNALILTQKEKTARFEKEMLEARRNLEQELNQQQRERVQEENEYLLKRDTSRKLEQEQYETTRRELENELTTKRTAFEEEFSMRESRLAARESEHQKVKEREARITAREQEYFQLKEKVKLFPEELRSSVQKAERSVSEHLTRKYEYDTRLAHIELESERKLYQQKIAALEEQIEQYKMLKEQFGHAFNPDNRANIKKVDA